MKTTVCEGEKPKKQSDEKKSAREPMQKIFKQWFSSSSLPPPPIFAMWAAKMTTYLRAQSLWDVLENCSNPPPLPKTQQLLK